MNGEHRREITQERLTSLRAERREQAVLIEERATF